MNGSLFFYILEGIYAILLSGYVGALEVVSVEHVLNIGILAFQPMKRINHLKKNSIQSFYGNRVNYKIENWVENLGCKP